MKSLSILDWTALTLLAVGGINWGLISLFDFNLVTSLFGDMTVLARVIYGAVGIAAIYLPFSMLAATADEASYATTTRKVHA
jgi:uncharacterized membrane protein YuzA (DUF378 family)